MKITYCDNCDIMVDHSEDCKRFIPYKEIDGKVICNDCEKEAKLQQDIDFIADLEVHG